MCHMKPSYQINNIDILNNRHMSDCIIHIQQTLNPNPIVILERTPTTKRNNTKKNMCI